MPDRPNDAIEEQLRALVAAEEFESALRLMMQEYGGAVLAHARRVLGEDSELQDVYQRTFAGVFRDLRSFQGRSTFKTWLLAIANYRALDAVRRLRREQKRSAPEKTLSALADDKVDDPRRGLDIQLTLRALEECLQRLSEEVRGTVLLRYHQALSYEDMARSSGEHSGTLHARVTRALLSLRKCLESKGVSL